MAMAAFSLTALSLPHPPLRSRAHSLPKTKFQILSSGRLRFFAAASSEIGALDEGQKPLLTQQEPVGVEESVNVLKRAARTRRVPKAEVLAALDAIKKAKANPTAFLETLGGSESPGRTWMLIFTAEGRLDKGRYFPVTAVQRFDAARAGGRDTGQTRPITTRFYTRRRRRVADALDLWNGDFY